jgi:hypothetical protein
VGREGFALIYLDPATPTVRACGLRSAVLVTNMPWQKGQMGAASASRCRMARSQL